MVVITPQIETSWKAALKEEFSAPYFADIKSFLLREKKRGKVIFPPGKLIFNAFNLCPFDKVKVVILGQDPYHGPGQAHGLCFSVRPPVPPPPSLVNIFQELHRDIGFKIPNHGNLENWVKQGVFLLNTSLTVEANKAGSHSGIGWQKFTDAVIQNLNQKKSGLIFLLWGRPAQNKSALIDTQKHTVLKTTHPSPLSAYRGFTGCGHFSEVNRILQSRGQKPIDWKL